MTWEYLDVEHAIPSRKFLIEHEGKIVPVALFMNKETEEIRFFTERKLEEIGVKGILEILNSTAPASLQGGE